MCCNAALREMLLYRVWPWAVRAQPLGVSPQPWQPPLPALVFTKPFAVPRVLNGLRNHRGFGLCRRAGHALLLARQDGRARNVCTRREPFNSTPMAVNSISSGSPHVHPMGRTCGEPDEIKKNTHPKNITALFRDQAKPPLRPRL